MSGRFITFEGPDGSGKSTHFTRAADWLRDRGIDVVCSHEPGGTALGRAMRQVFLESPWDAPDGSVEALLLFAARRQHLRELIEPALAEGRWVLCDRFTDSTLAYQGAGRGVPIERLRELDRWATGSRQPYLTLLFDLPPDKARRRGQSDRRRKSVEGVNRLDVEDLAFYERVREGFLSLARAEPDRFRVIDSSASVEETAAQVEAVLIELTAARV